VKKLEYLRSESKEKLQIKNGKKKHKIAVIGGKGSWGWREGELGLEVHKAYPLTAHECDSTWSTSARTCSACDHSHKPAAEIKKRF
jgi:hypothetical protein